MWLEFFIRLHKTQFFNNKGINLLYIIVTMEHMSADKKYAVAKDAWIKCRKCGATILQGHRCPNGCS